MKIVNFILLCFFCFLSSTLIAQEKKIAPTSPELYAEISNLDTLLFQAFNTQNMADFQDLFSKDLEWYQDNGGLLNYETVFANFATMFKNEHKLTRKLVPGSLEVHPIKDFGAIEIGLHEFRHIENGKEEIGTFKFMAIWKKTNGKWQISRMISYDH